jgi:hypothetical protein
MRSGVLRSALRTEAQIEAGLSTAAGHDTQHAARINHLLNRYERQLAADPRYNWPTLTFEAEVTVSADSATGSLPSGIAFTMVKDVWTLYGSEWFRIHYGIGAKERSIFGPDQRCSPITKWEITADDPTEYEVWPISATDETLRFTGRKVVGEMDEDTDVCLLDGDALVLMAAGKLMAKTDPDAAALAFKEAERIIMSIQSGQPSAPDANLADRQQPALRPWLDYIPTTG